MGSCSNAIEKGNSPIGNCWPTILTLLIVANLVDALKTGESIQLATGSQPSLSINNADDSSLEQLIEMRLNESASASVQNSQSASQELLSRKRRYLVFPEGSSFQMVYDEIVGMVDHTNYLILGITVALAWELPSKPPSEELDDLLTKLEDGTIDISRNDTVSNITYVDVDADASTTTTSRPADYKPNYINLSSYGSSSSSSGSNSYYSQSPVFRTPMHPSHRYADSYYSSRPKGGRRKDNHYYYSRPGVSSSSSNPFAKWTRPYSHAQNSRYPYWALNSR
ncbi:GD18293 [Drosophila simulans]|uniref:GD18293 n=2 Tax=Drosophila simulans TaxID=7240 RepID=B4QT60_DROSI|nr:GD18293 [Drosophila simulans]